MNHLGTKRDAADWTGTPEAFEAALENAVAGDPPAKFPLVHVRELLAEPKPREFVVENVLERGAMGGLVADPSGGKTLLAIDIACCVATGMDWHEHRTLQGPVVYILGEGHAGIGGRLLAWAIRHDVNLTDAPIYLSKRPAEFVSDSSTTDVIDAIRGVNPEPVLVVIDTLARNFGADENSTADMGRFIQNVDAVRGHFGCAVLVVHHTGHMAKDRGRGSSAFRAALDHEYMLEKNELRQVTVTCTKAKDIAEHKPLHFKMRTVELPWNDAHGKPVTSVILHPHTPEEPDLDAMMKLASNQPTGKNQRKALSLLRELNAEQTQNVLDSGRDASQVRVTFADWHDRCKANGMKRQAFADVKRSLIASGHVKTNGEFVSENVRNGP